MVLESDFPNSFYCAKGICELVFSAVGIPACFSPLVDISIIDQFSVQQYIYFIVVANDCVVIPFAGRLYVDGPGRTHIVKGAN